MKKKRKGGKERQIKRVGKKKQQEWAEGMHFRVIVFSENKSFILTSSSTSNNKG